MTQNNMEVVAWLTEGWLRGSVVATEEKPVSIVAELVTLTSAQAEIAVWKARAEAAENERDALREALRNSREALAEHLCSEFDEDFIPIPKAHWPEDENDDGKREGGYVAIQPKHVQARALEQADRILAFLSALQPLEPKNDPHS